MIHELKEIDNRKFKYMEQWLARKMVIFESMNTMVQEMEVVANGQYEVQADGEQLWIVLSPFKKSSQ